MKRILALLSFAAFVAGSPLAAQSAGPELIAYFPEWGIYLEEPFHVRNIVEAGSAEHLTTLIYAFAYPKPDATGQVVCTLFDPWAAYQIPYASGESVDGEPDESGQVLKGHFNQLKKLKADFPNVKVLVALGGWTGSTWFSDAALTDASRKAFVSSCIDMFIAGNLPVAGGAGGAGGAGAAAGVFDGFDIDWEYPISGGDTGVHHNSNDDVNLSLLLEEFRRQMDAFPVVGPDLLLTIATPASNYRAQNFRINQDQQYVDWFNIMTYDFHGGWDNATGHLTNLLTSPDDPSSDAFKLSVDASVRLYTTTYGVQFDQLVIGGTFYGRGWKGVSATNNGLYQSGQPAEGRYEPGVNYFYDLWPLINLSYELYWDDKALASWLYSPTAKVFWSFDEHQSLALKRRYVDAYGLKGAMIWEISGDDAAGSLMKSLASGNANGGEGSAGPPQGPQPGVTITKPADCAISLEGFNTVTQADVTGTGISHVEFFGNGTSLGIDNRAPYSWGWFNLPPGTHEIVAVAEDESGYRTSAPTRLTVYQEGPNLSLWATGVSYPVGVRVFYEGCIYESKRNHVGSSVRLPGPGSRFWTLITCSDCGGGNVAPTVSITSPANESSFTLGTAIGITADASDTDGSIAQVAFFADGTAIGTDASSPYEASWTPSATGTYTLTAVATDNADASTTSSPVSVTVTSSGGGGACAAPAWNSTTAYRKGDVVSHQGKDWRAKKNSTNIEPGTSAAYWANLGACATTSSATSAELQAYPNPFNPATTLTFELSSRSVVRLEVFDALGRLVAVPIEGDLDSGNHVMRFDGSALPGGMYLCRLHVNGQGSTRAVLLLK